MPGVILVALGVPAPTVVGHVAEDQSLGFSIFREGAPGNTQEQEPAKKVSYMLERYTRVALLSWNGCIGDYTNINCQPGDNVCR